IHSISPIVSAIAIGSLPPVSASNVRARRRRMFVNRSVANTAAASVEETTAPSRTDSSQERSEREYTTVLSSADVMTTWRNRRHEVARQLPGVALSGLALAALLVLFIRPLAVWLSTAFSQFTTRERALLGWAGLRGAEI